jgi:hypothetical protein
MNKTSGSFGKFRVISIKNIDQKFHFEKGFQLIRKLKKKTIFLMNTVLNYILQYFGFKLTDMNRSPLIQFFTTF